MMSGGSKMILRAERNGIIIATMPLGSTTMLACSIHVGSNYYLDRPIYTRIVVLHLDRGIGL